MIIGSTARSLAVLTSVALLTVACSGAAQTTAPGTTVRLDPVGNSGISGTVQISPRGNETDFATTLSATAEADRPREFDVRIRAGTCSAPGRVVDNIGDLRADGRTDHEDEDIRFEELRRTGHIIEVTVEDSDQVVACGGVPQGS